MVTVFWCLLMRRVWPVVSLSPRESLFFKEQARAVFTHLAACMALTVQLNLPESPPGSPACRCHPGTTLMRGSAAVKVSADATSSRLPKLLPAAPPFTRHVCLLSSSAYRRRLFKQCSNCILLFSWSIGNPPAAAAMSGQGLIAMAAPPSPLPNDTADWDLNLLFNEDECRDFLNEVGNVVVNSYIFSMGMEEAYCCIWSKYGPEGTSDAISLFHQMLEEDDVIGAGLGLDSDIWRPWKNNFRLRNVSPKARDWDKLTIARSILTTLGCRTLAPESCHRPLQSRSGRFGRRTS